MKKLTTVFSMLAFSTVLAVTGCKKGDGDADKATAKPTETETKPADKPAETKPDETKPTETKPTEAKAGDLPAECGEYKAAIEALAKCDKLPQATRDALKQSYEQTSTAWATVPAEGKAALGTACKSAADAVKQSAAACN
jgi:hypothetical protein